MDCSASDSQKEIARTSNFSKLSKTKTKQKQQKKMIIILVNTVLHICLITFLKCKKFKGKSNSKYSNALKTVMG